MSMFSLSVVIDGKRLKFSQLWEKSEVFYEQNCRSCRILPLNCLPPAANSHFALVIHYVYCSRFWFLFDLVDCTVSSLKRFNEMVFA